MCIRFTWCKRAHSVKQVIRAIEENLRDLDPRPHWGGVFADLDPGTYERWDAMRHLIARVDPGGRFRNGFLQRLGLVAPIGQGTLTSARSEALTITSDTTADWVR